MTALGEKQAELQAVLKKLAALDTDLAEKVACKETLEAEVEMCKVKLDRCASFHCSHYGVVHAIDSRWRPCNSPSLCNAL